jgi:hypothetical protein
VASHTTKDQEDGYITKSKFLNGYMLDILFSSDWYGLLLIFAPIFNIIFIVMFFRDEYEDLKERKNKYVVNFKGLSKSEKYKLLSKALIDYDYFKSKKELYNFMDGVMVANKLTNNIGSDDDE